MLVGTKAIALKKDQGLVVKPLRQKIIQDPGSTTGGMLTLTNDSDQPLTVELTSENFGVINESYDYSFKSDESSGWVRFVDPVVQLEPREKRKISYSLAVPVSATPGGYDIALMSTIKSKSFDSTASEYHRVASLLYLDVNGDAERKGSILTFDLPWLTTGRNLEYTLRMANQGNTHLEFDIRLNSSLFWGGNDKQDTTKTLTLPRSVRSLSGAIDIGLVPGIYSVKATYSPPQGNKQVLTKRVLYIPWTFTWSIILLIAIIVFAGVERRKVFSKKQSKPKKTP